MWGNQRRKSWDATLYCFAAPLIFHTRTLSSLAIPCGSVNVVMSIYYNGNLSVMLVHLSFTTHSHSMHCISNRHASFSLTSDAVKVELSIVKQ